jgi:hypothetical protein
LGRWLLADNNEEKKDAGRLLLPFLDAERQPAFRGGDGDLQHVVSRLEATADGCRWLLDRWAEHRARLERGEDWGIDELVVAIYRLG